LMHWWNDAFERTPKNIKRVDLMHWWNQR
jgi:hypothetical protein